METETRAPEATVAVPPVHADAPPANAPRTAYRVIRRNGKLTGFDPTKIQVAMTKAFLAVEGGTAAASRRIHETVEALTRQVVEALTRRQPGGGTFHIEDIQDQVELALMRAGHHKVARAYVLYREARARERAARQAAEAQEAAAAAPGLSWVRADGSRAPLDRETLLARLEEPCRGLEGADPGRIAEEAMKGLYDGIGEDELDQALLLAARGLIERDPDHDLVAARLLLARLRREACAFLGLEPPAGGEGMARLYPEALAAFVRRGIELELLDPRLAEFDLEALGRALRPERDLAFRYLGLQTLYDRYFQRWEGTRFELPQVFFMRVAMGLALNEVDREARAAEFYELLSRFDFMSSTPTLFNSGTTRPQLSSCYLTTVPDDLDGIFTAIRHNALLSKFAGGLGNDWTRVRGMGAHIKGTNGTSQGVIPFLKVANDTAVAVNQGGRRKGAVCAYLEVWHIDFEDFLELRKNTGDERRRTHDMNTAAWVPDLFMKRVAEDGEWSLFSPDEVPDLHERYGRDFEEAYLRYEERALRGELRVHRRVRAVELWRRMLTMLFETGHPWITFKDPCNVRSPQRHAGVVHSSNLCTEITLNTSDEEIAVCNLGSVNLANHLGPDGLDHEKLRRTVRTAMRMLDNVIDINYYTVPHARRANLRHRPVGLGIMGFQDLLHRLGVPYASEEAVEIADRTMEAVSYYAIEASSDLALERGRYPSYEGSLWSQGVLPIDSIGLLERERGGFLDVDRSSTMDWEALRAKVRAQGMRNSNCLAIAPTATIANICGVSPSIEPTFQNLYVKSNLSGEFTVVNPHLVRELKARDLWDEVMVHDLKYYDGSLAPIDRVPEDLKRLYATAFEIDPRWLVEAAARRQKWIDQSQSLNLYLAEPSGRKLDALYKLAWVRGLKTTYYLRTRAATAVEKVAVRDDAQAPAGGGNGAGGHEGAVCGLDGECEACQ
ncbi:ribonucleoside-diphosphate reductase subunit alpha [Oceanithermus sp.]|uniref:ribonucleoside-diphosphate reductase subunit alpha n=1 Tax=Oceanithermus sp. TaxID=2268145 RepID=UPI00257D9100|nr:ribonucleoside-diphosphate reductase subunit alpha [Oceanithermus sp.]